MAGRGKGWGAFLFWRRRRESHATTPHPARFARHPPRRSLRSRGEGRNEMTMAQTNPLPARAPAPARLSLARLTQLPPAVVRPAYDLARVDCGILHLGIGAFHRAHQAYYTDTALADGGGDGW